MKRPVVFALGVQGTGDSDWFGAVMVYANGGHRFVYGTPTIREKNVRWAWYDPFVEVWREARV